MMRVIGGHQRVRIRSRVDEEAAAADLLLERVIDAQRRSGHDVLVVDVGGDADDAPGLGAHVDELHHGIGPHQPAVDGVLRREQPLRDALAHDDDLLGVAAIGLGEVAAGDDRHAERREESGRDGAEARARILFAVRPDVALGRELEARAEDAGVAPRHGRAHRDALHAGQLGDAPHRLLVEPVIWSGERPYDMTGTFTASTLRVSKPVLRRLQRKQRRQQHAGARQQHERRGDLRHREQTQAAVRARRDPHAAVRQAESVRRVRGRQTRNERQQDRRGQGQADAHPQQARIDGEIQRAHREARGIPRQNRHHRPRDDDAEDRARAAEQQALGEQRPAQRAGARAERRADGQLAFAAHRARQDQVRHVRARDDEDQRRRREQHQQDGSRRRGDLIAQPHGVDSEVGLRSEYASGCSLRMAPWTARSSARAASRSAPGASRPKSSVIRCTRPFTIVASRWCGLVTTLAMISVSAG